MRRPHAHGLCETVSEAGAASVSASFETEVSLRMLPCMQFGARPSGGSFRRAQSRPFWKASHAHRLLRVVFPCKFIRVCACSALTPWGCIVGGGFAHSKPAGLVHLCAYALAALASSQRAPSALTRCINPRPSKHVDFKPLSNSCCFCGAACGPSSPPQHTTSQPELGF